MSSTRRPIVRTSAGLVVTAIACLMRGERELNLSPRWRTCNERQVKLFEVGNQYRAVVLSGALPIETEFSPDSSIVNQFFAARGIPIELSECGPDEYATGAVMSITVNWLVEGEETQVTIDDRTVVGAHVAADYDQRRGGWNMTFHGAEGHDHPVVRLATKEGYNVLLTKAPHLAGLDGPELFERGLAIFNGLKDLPPANYAAMEQDFNGVIFPESAYAVEVDMNYLVNLETPQEGTGQTATIVEAKGFFRGRIDRKGAEQVEAVGTITALESSMSKPEPNPVIIDEVFLVIYEKIGSGAISVVLVGDDAWTTVGDTEAASHEHPTAQEPEGLSEGGHSLNVLDHEPFRGEVYRPGSPGSFHGEAFNPERDGGEVHEHSINDACDPSASRPSPDSNSNLE